VDVKALKTYQQVFVYITPIVTNLGFINIIVVVVRLRWFGQKLKDIGTLSCQYISICVTNEHAVKTSRPRSIRRNSETQSQTVANTSDPTYLEEGLTGETLSEKKPPPTVTLNERGRPTVEATHEPSRITFAPDPRGEDREKSALYIPGPRERDNGAPITSISDDEDEDEDRIKPVAESSNALRRRRSNTRSMDTRSMSQARSVDRAVSSIFVLGSTASRRSDDEPRCPPVDLASMSRDELGGVEYRALRVLLKVTVGYFVGLHTFGVICLVPWIHLADSKYKDYLVSQGQDFTWWAFYSSQTMINNLGLTLTPDSMLSFRDATWPILVMTFLAFAGNTFYPCFLRLLIWTIYELAPRDSSLQESTRFLLNHPRRCYTLLFPGTATWILAGILIILNFIDTLLIVVLDLDNPEVNVLPVGPRILAALFQSASSRHTGTSTFNLANVNPAVQFSLLVMMYISVYPIAISIRMSESYDNTSVGVYSAEESLDEQKGSKTYLISHMRNQLSFDLWYIFLGVFCVCIAESKRIMSKEDYVSTTPYYPWEHLLIDR
jgi:hypothetical protein